QCDDLPHSLSYLRCHHLWHPFPTRRSSDLPDQYCRVRSAWASYQAARAAAGTDTTDTTEATGTTGTEAPSETTGTETTDATEARSEEHTSELQSRFDLVCRLLLEKKKEV